MNPFDALFLAVAAERCSGSPGAKSGWVRALPALIPLASVAIRLLPAGSLAAPLVAVLAALAFPAQAPAALLLALPAYPDWSAAAQAGALWWLVGTLMNALEDRLEDAEMPARWRGLPARWLACAALYFALMPVELIRWSAR